MSLIRSLFAQFELEVRYHCAQIVGPGHVMSISSPSSGKASFSIFRLFAQLQHSFIKVKHIQALLVPLVLTIALALLYAAVISVLRGNGEWPYVDFISYRSIFWGDDAYRWFLARSAWINSDIYWFNFSLPAWVLLDGTVASLSHQDLLHARWIKSGLTAFSVFCVYQTCLNLNVSRVAAFFGGLLLSCMPLYFMVGMSFYGESWQIVLVSLAMLLYSSQYRKTALLVVAAMPLVHPEGLYFVIVLALLALRDRIWFEAVAPISFGFLYFLLLISISPDLHAFFQWRIDAAKMYKTQGQFYGWGGINMFQVFFIPWLVASVLGTTRARARPLIGFYVGSFLAIAGSLKSIFENNAFFEPRYYTPMMPALMIGFSVFVDEVKEGSFGCWARKRWKPIATLMMVSTLAFQLGTLSVLKKAIVMGLKDAMNPFEYLSTDPAKGGRLYGLSVTEKEKLKEYAKVVEEMLQANPDIRTLIVNNVLIFYFLDPRTVPASVNVVIPIFNRSQMARFMRGDEAAGYFAEAPYFAHFNLNDPRSERYKILYLDSFPLPNYPFHWRVGGSRFAGANDIYLFGGHMLTIAL